MDGTMGRTFKDALYAQFARIGHAVSAPKRLELLDLLAQTERTVEALADAIATPIKNTSAHLRVLRAARLVETRKEGTYVFYRLADDRVGQFVRDLQALGRNRLAEIEQTATAYIDAPDGLEPVSLRELARRVRAGDVTVIDVRPAEEYAAGHIPGALSLPLAQLKHGRTALPKHREVVAYCRGPYCIYATEAVALLRKRGYRARRATDGVPEWRTAGERVVVGG
jgi:rhodanese-related sulfurtransferase